MGECVSLIFLKLQKKKREINDKGGGGKSVSGVM